MNMHIPRATELEAENALLRERIKYLEVFFGMVNAGFGSDLFIPNPAYPGEGGAALSALQAVAVGMAAERLQDKFGTDPETPMAVIADEMASISAQVQDEVARRAEERK